MAASERCISCRAATRGGVFALGYPTITVLGHLINLAELVTLAGVLYVLLVGGATLFNALTSRSPASGRKLLREIRSSNKDSASETQL